MMWSYTFWQCLVKISLEMCLGLPTINHLKIGIHYIFQAYVQGAFPIICNTIDIKKPGAKMRLFGEKCAEVSWFMLACDPPMALQACKKGEVFQSDKYKAYTKSERNMNQAVVEMPVWPTLLLHDGGPVVTRGIAQPMEGATSEKKK